MESRVALHFVEGPGAAKNNGSLKRRVALDRDEETLDIASLQLDSALAKQRQVTAWAKQFGIDADVLARKLARASIMAAEEAQQLTKRPLPDQRVSDVARAFLRNLKPTHHRKRRALYLEAHRVEVLIGNLWNYASDTDVDAVTDTVEGYELADLHGSASYRNRLLLFKDAVSMAAAHLMNDLPDVDDVGADPTIDRDQLLARLITWLLRERSFRPDHGNPFTTTYYAWAHGIEPGSGWQECFTAAVFGHRQDDALGVAVKGQVLAADLRCDSSRKLASDLRAAGFADTDRTVKVTGNVWRVWILARQVLEAVATEDRSNVTQ